MGLKYEDLGFEDDDKDYWISSRMRYICDELQNQKRRCPVELWDAGSNCFKRETRAWDAIKKYLR
ncbi:MAG: hypothetical protein L6R41_007086 [Letrouitia leprolyta]|nr:MAG: hypothetical protein L6R41_007086 [Letrouitia leprolyta]